MRIPWKVLEDFDLQQYTVCNNVSTELDNFYDKSSLELFYTAPVVSKHKDLQSFLLLKMELHLLYDSICRPNIITDIMPAYTNLLLKRNLLSIKNFVEIKNGSLEKSARDWISKFRPHFTGCPRCKLKGKTCASCGDAENMIYLFEVENTRICKRCKQVYHRACWAVKGCVNCDNG